MTAPPLVAIYADESCLGNGREGENPGGAGGLVEWRNPRTGALVLRDYWISEPATTNNRMAIRSAIEGLTAIAAKGRRFEVVFTSDSEYLVKGAGEWLRSWKARGWKRRGGEIMNLELWQQLDALLAQHRVRFRWVRGHDAHPQNEYAHHLAIRAAREQTRSNGLVESEFDRWLEAARRAGRITRDPDPFPSASRERTQAPLP